MKTNQTELGSRSRSSHRARWEPLPFFLSLLPLLLSSSSVVFFFFSGTSSAPAFPISPCTSHSVHSEQAVLFYGPLTSNMSYSRNDNDRNMPGKIRASSKNTLLLFVLLLAGFLTFFFFFFLYFVVIDLVSGFGVIGGCSLLSDWPSMRQQ